MRTTAFLLLGILLLTGAHQVRAQSLQVEATAGASWLHAPRSSFEMRHARVSALLLGYNLTPRHSLWAGVGYISAEAIQRRQPANESGIRVRLQSLPIHAGYRYVPLRGKEYASFVYGNFLILPTRDQWTSDVPTESSMSRGLGVDVGAGLRWRLGRSAGLVIKAGYREAGAFHGDRYGLAIDQDGPHVELGMQLPW